jgi:hypothetical protein
MRAIPAPPNFPPPAAAASLYFGDVMHARLKPFGHRFTYRVFSLLIDLDRLAEAGRASRFFSIGRFNLMGFSETDHGPGDGSPLRPHIDRLLARAGLAEPPARILLLCYPRILGAVFDPLSIYYCYAGPGALVAIVYEVRNTFGERHTYVAPVRAGELGPAGLRQQRDKLFYVSPFIDMAQRYHFRLRPPGDEIAVRILESDGEGPMLAATFSGERLPLTSATVLSAFFRRPALPLRVLGGIHWEALKLWLKGAKLQPRPNAPELVSYGRGASDAAAAECSAMAPALPTG